MEELDKLALLVAPKVLAAALGVHAKTLRRWEVLRGFPAAKRGPGQRALYNREAVRAWLLAGEVGRD
jgi:DNA-binding transcriptional MerR regulator